MEDRQTLSIFHVQTADSQQGTPKGSSKLELAVTRRRLRYRQKTWLNILATVARLHLHSRSNTINLALLGTDADFNAFINLTTSRLISGRTLRQNRAVAKHSFEDLF
ncbi:unnamed protein product [Caenorhabditis auriculariae]|uniref:Uncharacterized protein n=1 Tax=Caenorhabditis auriculariae TaxID=2777116 RepID=A0A8S1GX96_9PELO|nr:unnamed protein product [Caenorhabditis auriculariae]